MRWCYHSGTYHLILQRESDDRAKLLAGDQIHIPQLDLPDNLPYYTKIEARQVCPEMIYPGEAEIRVSPHPTINPLESDGLCILLNPTDLKSIFRGGAPRRLRARILGDHWTTLLMYEGNQVLCLD